jgi:hypothetical protein
MKSLVPFIFFVMAVFAARADIPAVAQDKPEPKKEFGVVVFKLGEKYATDDKAGETIDSLCTWLGKQVEGATFTRRGVRNKPADALKLLKDTDKPVAVAIVSPGFYFKYKSELKLTALAEARRDGNDGEQYVILGLSPPEKYPAGLKVATGMAADADWLAKTVLPAPKDAKPIEWKQYDNLFDAGYEVVDHAKDGAEYVLVDRVTLKAMLADQDLKVLKAGIKSELLPQDLVVEVDGRLGDKREALKKALKELDETEEGRKLGKNLQSAAFPAPDEKRLERVAKLYE